MSDDLRRESMSESGALAVHADGGLMVEQDAGDRARVLSALDEQRGFSLLRFYPVAPRMRTMSLRMKRPGTAAPVSPEQADWAL